MKRVVGYIAFQTLGGLCLTLGWSVDTDALPLWRFVAVWVVATFLIEMGARFRTANVPLTRRSERSRPTACSAFGSETP